MLVFGKQQHRGIAVKNFAASLLAASILIGTASAAEAQQAWPNWYVGLHGAMAFVGEEDIAGNPSVSSIDTDTGFGYGASLGYRIPATSGEWSNMRIAAEWHHQRADISGVGTPLGGVAGQGDVRVNAGMFNVFYDAVISMPSWRPYVGVGVGFADVQLKNAAGVISGGDSDNVFAWNLMAGVGYIPETMPFTEISAGYRYFRASDAEFGLVGGGTYDLEYDSHNIEAGIKFLF